MNIRRILIAVLGLLLHVPGVRAQVAVIDVAAIAQLVAQAQTLESELLTARNQLSQIQLEYASITGGRGMQTLLAGAPRNYLPTDWAQLEQVMQGTSGAYGALSGVVTGTVSQQSVLSDRDLADLPAGVRADIRSGRSLAALDQALARAALTTTSARFDSLQGLIAALGGATDQKAVLDLQARIAAETAMLQNEHTKLQTLFAAVAAQQRADERELREQAMAAQGHFDERFQPVP